MKNTVQDSEQKSTALAVLAVPFDRGHMLVVEADGAEWVLVKPVAEATGLSPEAQRQTLLAQAWAGKSRTRNFMVRVPGDDRARKHFAIQRTRFAMWMACMNQDLVDPSFLPTLQKYQDEAADVLDAYFNHGAAINVRFGNQTSALRQIVIDALAPLVDRISALETSGLTPTAAAELSVAVKDFSAELGSIRKDLASVKATVLPHTEHPERFLKYQTVRNNPKDEQNIAALIQEAADKHRVEFARVHGILVREFKVSSYRDLGHTQIATAEERLTDLRRMSELPPRYQRVKPTKPQAAQYPGQLGLFAVLPN